MSDSPDKEKAWLTHSHMKSRSTVCLLHRFFVCPMTHDKAASKTEQQFHCFLPSEELAHCFAPTVCSNQNETSVLCARIRGGTVSSHRKVVGCNLAQLASCSALNMADKVAPTGKGPHPPTPTHTYTRVGTG